MTLKNKAINYKNKSKLKIIKLILLTENHLKKYKLRHRNKINFLRSLDYRP